MALQISMLEEAVQRLHVRLQRQIRALYVLHSNGNDEAALIALDRISQLNAKIAELNALLDSFEEPAQPAPMSVGCEREDGTLNIHPETETCEVCADLPKLKTEVVGGQVRDFIDDPDQDDLEMEYRGAVYMTVGIIILIGLMIFFFPKLQSLVGDISQEAVRPMPPSAVQVIEQPPAPPVVVETVAVTETTYVVQKGDSLWKIAAELYGDANQWTVIYGQNAEVIGDNPDLIFPGQTLTLTKVSTGTVPVG